MIPFYPQSKTPAFATGEIFAFREQPASTAQLKAWFADPERNIGLITGAGSLVVLDVDGDEGRQSLKGLALPPTPTVLTKRGFHAYFRADRPLQTRINGLPGIDLLADEWQVLAPSSIHPDRHVYAWEPGKTLANLALAAPTPWMLELAHAHPPDPETPETTNQLPIASLEKGASNQKTRLLALFPRLLAPTPLDGLSGWPAVLQRLDVNLACAQYLGLLSVEVGKKFVCVLPGHPQDHRAASLYWNTKGEQSSGTLKYCDGHYASGERWYSLADVFASRNYGEVVRLKGPETTVWQLRLLIAAGVVLPYRVHAPLLPPGAPRHVVRVYDGFRELLAAKWLHTPDEPTPFTWRFAAAWCGMRSARQIGEAMTWLLRYGYVRQVGVYRPGAGRKMALFLPGAP